MGLGKLREDADTPKARVWLRRAELADSDKATRKIALAMLAAIVFTGQLLARQSEGGVDTANNDRVVGVGPAKSTVSGSTISEAVALVMDFRAEDE